MPPESDAQAVLERPCEPAPSAGMTAPSAPRKPATVPFRALVGFVLTTLYFVLTQLLPDTGVSEFIYAMPVPDFQLLSPMRGFTFEQLCNHVLRVLVLGPGLLLLSSGLARALALEGALPLRPSRACLAACALSPLVTFVVMLFVLHGLPIVQDEITYAAMARTFAQGLLVEPAFRGQVLDGFEVAARGGVTGKYLFGEPLLQVLGVRVGLPALLHLPINAVSLL